MTVSQLWSILGPALETYKDLRAPYWRSWRVWVEVMGKKGGEIEAETRAGKENRPQLVLLSRVCSGSSFVRE